MPIMMISASQNISSPQFWVDDVRDAGNDERGDSEDRSEESADLYELRELIRVGRVELGVGSNSLGAIEITPREVGRDDRLSLGFGRIADQSALRVILDLSRHYVAPDFGGDRGEWRGADRRHLDMRHRGGSCLGGMNGGED